MAGRQPSRPGSDSTGRATEAVDDEVRVIDLTALEERPRPDLSWQLSYTPPSPAERPVTRGRRLLLTAVFGILLATAASLGSLAWINYERALDWQEHARRLDDRVVELQAALQQAQDVVDAAERSLVTAEDRVAAAEDEATGVHQQLVAAETEISALEGRISALANEKAQAEDERWLATGNRGRAAQVGVQMDVLEHDLQDCAGDLQQWLGTRPAEDDPPHAWTNWSEQGDGIAAACGAVASGFRDVTARLP